LCKFLFCFNKIVLLSLWTFSNSFKEKQKALISFECVLGQCEYKILPILGTFPFMNLHEKWPVPVSSNVKLTRGTKLYFICKNVWSLCLILYVLFSQNINAPIGCLYVSILSSVFQKILYTIAPNLPASYKRNEIHSWTSFWLHIFWRKMILENFAGANAWGELVGVPHFH